MKQLAIIGAVVALAAGAGYWFGGKVSHGDTPPTAAAPAAGKKLLYYRNPMGQPDTSPVPKKDPMGMDYIPVYEGEETAAGDSGIKVSAERVQRLGVKSAVVERRVLDRIVRAAGRVEIDERRVFAVAPKFEGWIERLHVNATGQPVGRGQPLFEVYSPELVSAQREYAIAAKAAAEASGDTQAAMRQLADAALARLRNWDISEEQIKRLASGGEARTLTFRSPVAGVVTEKKALQGARFMPGETLYQVADVSAVWVVADVPAQDIALVKTGARARLAIDAYPGRGFEGTVSYIYPTMKAETRTIPVRLELANPGGLLKPAMYAQVEFAAAGRGAVPTVPVSAVIDSGARKVAIVELGEGRFESREVKTGARGDQYVEVLEGLREGERVVVAGNFLIDSESNLKASLGGMEKPKASGVGHHADGTLDAIDARAGTVTITHQPVASLKWPAMTMEFVPANPALLAGVKPGTPIAFEFVERKPGEWVITKIEKRN
ncbi:MAG TPA: efflux RND transporter periplasmic adaptor subunit [Rhodocyclaceae bacterium]|nr:efflux RND transporter periplasmic adaptor subunit [Rhodocyclaceae bacterium]